MPYLTEAARRSLGMAAPAPKEPAAKLTIGFVVSVVHEAFTRDNAEDLIGKVGARRAPNGWLAKQRRRSVVEANREGKYTFRGRACCFDHLRNVERELAHRRDIPFETTCPGCQSVYRILRGIVAAR